MLTSCRGARCGGRGRSLCVGGEGMGEVERQECERRVMSRSGTTTCSVMGLRNSGQRLCGGCGVHQSIQICISSPSPQTNVTQERNVHAWLHACQWWQGPGCEGSTACCHNARAHPTPPSQPDTRACGCLDVVCRSGQCQ